MLGKNENPGESYHLVRRAIAHCSLPEFSFHRNEYDSFKRSRHVGDDITLFYCCMLGFERLKKKRRFMAYGSRHDFLCDSFSRIHSYDQKMERRSITFGSHYRSNFDEYSACDDFIKTEPNQSPES